MATGPAAATTMLEAFGMDVKEIIALKDAAQGSLSSPILSYPGIPPRSIPGRLQGYSQRPRGALDIYFLRAGRATLILLLTPNQPGALATRDDVLTTLLASPVMPGRS
jgi:hypothetical protein